MSAYDDVVAATAAEYSRATTKFAAFNSPHEGYAVLLEEVQEHAEDQRFVEERLNLIWTMVRANETGRAVMLAGQLESAALRMAGEAVQVAAMARRLQTDLDGAS